MESRNILDYQGNVVGQLQLPVNTPEEIWQKKLAVFAKAPDLVLLPDITPRQIRKALVMQGVSLDAVTASLNSLPEPEKSLAIIEWEYATIYERNHPLVAGVSQLLGFSSAQLDELWMLASSL